MARTIGSKDKQKRRSRLATAGMVGGGAAGYGASVALRAGKQRQLRPESGFRNRAGKVATDDFNAVKSRVGAGFNTAKAMPGSAFREVKGGFKGSRSAMAKDFSDTRMALSGPGNLGQRTRAVAKTGLGKAGLALSGLAAAGAGYGVYKMLKNRNKRNR
jgi:hypothetical protein